MNSLVNVIEFHAPIKVETVDEALVMVDRAYQALTEAVDFQSTRQVRNLAVAAAAYAREAKDTRLLSRATELRTRAERKAGQMLIESAKSGERATKDGNVNPGTKVSQATTPSPPTLAEIGISRDQSSQWQAVGNLGDDEFEDVLEATKAITHEISAPKVLRVMKQMAQPRGPELVDADDDRVAPMPEPAPLTPDWQATLFYNSVRDLGSLTLTAAEMHAALPFYQHYRIFENIARARALLQEVSESWTD